MQEVDGGLGPKREEWGLINKYKAAEFERMKAMEKSVDRDKKLAFRYFLCKIDANWTSN